MSSVFSRIIAGDEPARFIWSDTIVVAFLTIAPLSPGHTLVVPRRELDQWTDVPSELFIHCMTVAQTIGQAVKHAFGAPRAGLVIAGYEIAHLQVHVFPSWSMRDFDWTTVQHPSGAELDGTAERLRSSLLALTAERS